MTQLPLVKGTKPKGQRTNVIAWYEGLRAETLNVLRFAELSLSPSGIPDSERRILRIRVADLIARIEGGAP